jgi:hypothetical protein
MHHSYQRWQRRRRANGTDSGLCRSRPALAYLAAAPPARTKPASASGKPGSNEDHEVWDY